MSCEKSSNSPITLPTITTSSVSGGEARLAIRGGNMMSNGGETITAAGVIWSDAIKPTISLATKTIDKTSIGSFTSNITGLSLLTDYYVVAYATNSVGTGYGAPIFFSKPEKMVTTLADSGAPGFC